VTIHSVTIHSVTIHSVAILGADAHHRPSRCAADHRHPSRFAANRRHPSRFVANEFAPDTHAKRAKSAFRTAPPLLTGFQPVWAVSDTEFIR